MSPIAIDSHSDVEKKLNQIEEHLNIKDPNKIHQNIAWKNIDDFLKDYHIFLLDEVYVEFLIKLTIKLASVVYTQIKIRDSYLKKKKQIKDSKRSLGLYKYILTILVNHKYPIVYQTIVDAIEENNLWPYESFCTKITEIFLNLFDSTIITKFIDIVGKYIKDKDNMEIRKVNTLFNILVDISGKSAKWPANDEDYLLKLIGYYVICIDFKSNTLRRGIEACIKNSLTGANSYTLLATIDYVLEVYSVKDLEETYLRNLENIVQIASYMLSKCDSIWTTFKYDTLKTILTLIASENKEKCIFGNETFQNMIDADRNAKNFSSPKIFFIKIDYKLRFEKVYYNGEEFLKKYRKEFHVCFLTAIANHKNDIKIMTSVYTSICLLMTAIPCEFTAAVLVCLIMNIQKITLSDETISSPASHRIHALVISIMSLVCWVSQAKMLYMYMEKILKLRAYNAPFLNPPYKNSYTYATHYVLWNKPNFFFEKFDVRYAMWKRFRLNEKYTDRPCIFDKLKTLSTKKS